MERPPFQFKKFAVEQSPEVHPVGIDGILLGAWVPLPTMGRILEVGTGTGLVSLILAQRSAPDVRIDAIDIHAESVDLARKNASNAPWPRKIACWQADAKTWTGHQPYQLIVSNPPFFSGPAAPAKAVRLRARHTSSLRGADLLALADRVLLPTGSIALIVPPAYAQQISEQGACRGWYAVQWVDVLTVPGKNTSRVLLVLARAPGAFSRQTFELLDAQKAPSTAFKVLCDAFYEAW